MIAPNSLDRQALIAELRRLGALMHSSKAYSVKPFMDVDLTMAQLRVVFLLAEAGPMRMSLLAQELGITSSACSHLVDKLVSGGLVSRGEDPGDRRVVRCSLAEEGKALAERLRQSNPFERPEFLDRLTIDELRAIVQAMAVFQRVMGELQEEARPPG